MKICKSPEFNRKINKPVVVAIGSFDGIHLGHQKIINKTKTVAENLSLPSGVFSFTPHPLRIINEKKAPSHLLSESQKEKKLADMDIDYYFKQKFTEKFSNISFKSFIKDILLEKINVYQVIVGEDFKFGNKAEGNSKLLIKLSNKYNFKVKILPHLKINDKVVSSSYIRNLIENGEVEKVPDFLGSYYEIEGNVISGARRGRQLGFPTANLKLSIDYILPPPGVYAGYANYKNKKYKAIANFGFNPTFTGRDYQIEIHILDFSKKIYTEKVSFEIIKFIRGEKKFDNKNELIEQINRDILYTNNVLW